MAVESGDVDAVAVQELRRLLGCDPHHRPHLATVAHQVERQGGDNAGHAGSLRCGDRELELLEGGLGLDKQTAKFRMAA